MHIMEGFLDVWWCIFWYLMCLPFLVVGIWKLRKLFMEHPEKKLSVAISGAFIFVLSSLKLPSVSGSSSHPTGTGLSTILSGPFITCVLSSIVLIFQALLLAHGGITTLGANVFSMGIVGPFVAYGVFIMLQRAKVHPLATVFITAFIADMATYITTSAQLALAYPSGGDVVSSMATFLGIFAITQIPLAVFEAILIMLFFDYLSHSRPELTRPELIVKKGSRMGWASRALIGIVIAAAIIAVPLLLLEGHAFEGADDKGGQAIQDIDPNYKPWFESLFTVPEEVVPYLFALQTAIGLFILILVIWLTRRRKKRGSHHSGIGMDELAYESPLRDWPPLGKFLLTISLLVISLLSSTFVVPIIVMFIGAVLLLYSTRLRFPRIVALALFDGILVIVVGCVVIALLTKGGGYIKIPLPGLDLLFYRDGLNLATMVLLRALAGMMVMLALVTSTPVPHLAHAFRQVRMPKELAELTILVYRYSFLLMEQLEVMHNAAACRLGFKGWRNRVRTSSRLAVGLFARSMEVAERSQVALQCRNFQGEFPTFRPPRRLTWAWVIGPLALAIVMLLCNLYLSKILSPMW